MYNDNSKLIEKTIESSKTKVKETKKEKETSKKNKKVKLSKLEKREKDLFKMKKQEQINRLLELGYSSRDMYLLKYEKDRVEMIIKLESKKSK